MFLQTASSIESSIFQDRVGFAFNGHGKRETHESINGKSSFAREKLFSDIEFENTSSLHRESWNEGEEIPVNFLESNSRKFIRNWI